MAEKSNNEWYTPAKYIEAARDVMGGIDLDPASCELANRTVKATRYYSKEDDGLSKEWYGRVWLNPPYGKLGKQSGTTAFVNKLIRAYETKDIEQAIILVLTGMYAKWFFDLLQYPVCWSRDKPRFIKPDGSFIQHAFGCSCFYLGPHEHKFIDTFSQFGRIAKAIDTPRRVEKPIPLWDAERIYA